MAKITDHPRLRVHNRVGATNGQVWTSFWWDGRAAGMKDIPLGTDYETAVAAWRECEERYAADLVAKHWTESAAAATQAGMQATGLLRHTLTSLIEVGPWPGVYFLLDARSVAYVGQSENVLMRMSGHQDKAFDAVKMIRVTDPEERLELERQYIRLLRPSLNIHLVGPDAETARL